MSANDDEQLSAAANSTPAPVIVLQQSAKGGFFKNLFIMVLLVALGAAGYMLFHDKFWPKITNPIPVQTIDRSQPPVLESIQDLSWYVAAEGKLQQVIDLQRNRRFVPDFLVNERILFVAEATVEVYVDFSKIGDDAIKVSDDQTVVIDLPAPVMGPPNINHETSYIVTEQRGAINQLGGIFGKDSDKLREVYLKAEKEVAEAARDSDMGERAQTNTRKMLEGLLRALGYTKVTINFAKP